MDLRDRVTDRDVPEWRVPPRWAFVAGFACAAAVIVVIAAIVFGW